jgi:7-cyano-7-deazaguanine synthase
MEQRSAICLISGGVDSATTAYHVVKDLKPKRTMLIFVDYGQRTYEYEKFCVERIAEFLNIELRIIDLRWLGDISTSLLVRPETPIPETKVNDLWDREKAEQRILRWWDPCRNAFLLLIGLAHAESFYISRGERHDVYIGIRRETPVRMKDNTPEFIEEMNRLVEHATHHGGYRVSAPLIEYDKDQVVRLGEKLGVPWDYTYSCYAGTGFTEVRGKKYPVHCGLCSNDKRRHIAFVQAGVPDPSIYVHYPRLSEYDVSVELGGYHISREFLENLR